MSKNFELMQQAGRERELALVHTFEPAPAPAAPAPAFTDGNGNSHCTEARFDLDDVTREECLRLVQRIFLLQSGESPQLVVFAGVDHGNGCSQICAAAAETLAKTVRSSICLVEANLRTPSLPERFGVQNHFGLTNALLEEGDVKSFAKPIQENLWLVSSGALSSDSPNLLNSLRLKKRFAELREEFEYVLVDAPPLTRYADAIALAQSADGVVLVLEANSTRREAALQAAEDLRAGQVRVLGAVLNKRTFPIPESLYRRL